MKHDLLLWKPLFLIQFVCKSRIAFSLTHDVQVSRRGDSPAPPVVDAALVEAVVLFGEGSQFEKGGMRHEVEGGPVRQLRTRDPGSGSQRPGSGINREDRRSSHIILVPEDQSHEILWHLLQRQVAGDQSRGPDSSSHE